MALSSFLPEHMSMDLVFVYGTLRRNSSNFFRIQDLPYLGEAYIQGTLLRIDWYPGLILQGSTLVKGEVYEIEDATLQKLDEFEGIRRRPDDEYQRVISTVQFDDGRYCECFIYEWLGGSQGYDIIEHGDWLLVDR